MAAETILKVSNISKTYRAAGRVLTVLERREAQGGRGTRGHPSQAGVAAVVAGEGIAEGQGRCGCGGR